MSFHTKVWLLALAPAAALLSCSPSTPSPLPVQSHATTTAAPTMASASPSSSVAADPVAGCPGDLSLAQANANYEQGLVAIKRAGEHPVQADLDVTLPLLRSAALSGHPLAQERYGSYVVGFWATDEMFWPKDKLNAVSALAMLRIVARRDPKSIYRGLAKDPVELRQEPLKRIPKAWIDLAIAEARAWERCHPVATGPTP